MSFTIKFYKNTDERIKVNKSLSNPYPLTGELKEGCSITSPSILIEKTGDERETLFDYNYAFIEKFNRYYFIDDVISENTHLWRINMSVDVLKSYADGIKSVSALVSRNENEYNDLIEDRNINYKYNKSVTTTKLTHSTTYNYTDMSYNYGFSYVASHYISPTAQDLTMTTYNVIDNYPSNHTFTAPIVPCSSLFKNMQTKGFGDVKDNMVTSYLPSYDDLKRLIGYVAFTSSKASYVSSVYAYPFSVQHSTDIINMWIENHNVEAYDSSTEKTITAQCYPVTTLGSDRIVLGVYSYDIPSNYLSFEPYSIYDLYIPFVGLVNIPSEFIYNHWLTIIFDVNYNDGSATYLLASTDKTTSNNTIVSSGNCQIGVPIPLTTTNLETIRNNIFSGVLNATIGGIGATLGMGGLTQALGMKNTRNNEHFGVRKERAVTSASTNVAQSTIGEFSDFNSYVSRGNVTIQTGLDGAFNPLDVYMQVTSVTPTIDIDNTTYAKLYGKPLKQIRTLSAVSGFTTCEEFHLEGTNFGEATQPELDEIDSLLRGGIIL